MHTYHIDDMPVKIVPRISGTRGEPVSSSELTALLQAGGVALACPGTNACRPLVSPWSIETTIVVVRLS